MKSARSSSSSQNGARQIPPRLLALAALCGIVLLLFLDVLLSPTPVVLSRLGADADFCFIPWREFAFRELGQGNLPLWDPCILSGCPMLGSFQAPLLYPPNWIYLALPIDRAVNLDITLHVLLAGLLMFAWMSKRGMSPLASLVASVLLMLGAPFYFHLYPGHLSPLAVMAWSPLILLVCDELIERPSLNWCLLGILAVALQVLAGYPQLFVYTAIAAGMYVVLKLPAAPHKWRTMPVVTGIYLGGVALSAVQLLTGLDAAGESVRGNRGLPFPIAASLSFPPENFVTLLAARFFRRHEHVPLLGPLLPVGDVIVHGRDGFGPGCAACSMLPATSADSAVAAAVIAILFVLALGGAHAAV